LRPAPPPPPFPSTTLFRPPADQDRAVPAGGDQGVVPGRAVQGAAGPAGRGQEHRLAVEDDRDGGSRGREQEDVVPVGPVECAPRSEDTRLNSSHLGISYAV